MFVVTYRKFFYIFSGILVVVSLLAVALWGLNLSIDFKGGSIIEVDYAQGRPVQSQVEAQLAPLNIEASVRPTESNGYLIRTEAIDQAQRLIVEQALGVTSIGSSSVAVATSSTVASVQETQFDSIGPVLGAEAARKSAFSVVLVIIAIVLFISYAFRHVSKPVSSWKYGIVAIIALLHDVIIPTGVFAILGHYLGYEVDTLFVTALLVVLGFSVHDTIVVFDRVRENLRHAGGKKPFAEVVGESISQTFTRSINTSLTTLLALIVLYFVGGQSTQHFALALIVGIAAGTYSSIFIGSPLLVTLERWQAKKAQIRK